MPRNGSGVYTPPAADFPAVSHTLIESAKYNDLINDMSTAMSASIAVDGQSTVTGNIPMSSHKLTGLAAGASNGDSVRYEQLQSVTAIGICNFRLTLTSTVPVTTSDVTGVSTVYITPYIGNRIALYDGATWNLREGVEGAIATGALSASKIYDVFVYDNAGTPASETLAWTNDTTRATGLTYQNGVVVKTGDATRRYIGSFRTDGSKQVNDSKALRHVWNYHNRVRKPMHVKETTDTWTYTTAVIRQANNSAANQLDFLIGVSEDAVTARLRATSLNATGSVQRLAGIGLDDTTTFDNTNGLYGYVTPVATGGDALTHTAFWEGYPGVGRHFLSWNEYSAATGTTTWYGDNALPGIQQSGIQGDIFC